MEGKAEFASVAVAVNGANTPGGYLVAARMAAPVNGPSMAAFPPVNVPPFFLPSTVNSKKKRGRPRKYAPMNSFGAIFSPVPISAIPLPPEFPVRKQEPATWLKPNLAVKGAFEFGSQTPGDDPSFQSGRDFTPHVITVYAGEDVAMKIMSVCPESRAISVVSANGWVSIVTIRLPDAVEGRVTHEGRFEIVSLHGSFVPMKKEALISRCGGLSVNVVDAKGKTIAGGLAGMLIAASNVLVTVGTFLPSGFSEQKRKSGKAEPYLGPVPTMGPPRDKEPMNPNGGRTQAGPLGQDNGDPWTGNKPSAMMILGGLSGNGQSRFMKSG